MAGSGNKSNNFWQFIVMMLLTFLLGTLVPYHIHFLERPVKELQAVILADTSLLAIDKSIKQDIKVTYKGEDIKTLSLVQLKLENSGNQEIREDDYENRPIKFIFPNSAKVVGANVVETSPPNVFPSNIPREMNSQQNITTLAPFSLNKGSRVIVRFLLIDMPQDYKKPFEIDAKIVGGEIRIIDAIEHKETSEKPFQNWLLIFISIFILTILILLLFARPAWKYLEEKFPPA